MSLIRCGSVAAALALSACANTHQVTIHHQPPASGQPLPVEFYNNLPIVKATVAGQELRLILDLGGHAAALALKEEMADRLPGVTQSGKRQMSLSASGDISVDRGLVAPELRVGDVVAAQVHGQRIRLPQALEPHVDGYIGTAFLRQFHLLVDYPERMVLYPRAAAPDLDLSGWMKASINDKTRSPAVLDGQDVTIGWDTGASHNVIDDDAAKRLGGRESGAVTARLAVDGHSSEEWEFRVIELRGAGVDAILGHHYFMRHRVLFDFAAKAVWIEP